MKRKSFFVFLYICVIFFSSCEESDGINNDLRANWKDRNLFYIDSIADVAERNPASWKKILNYKLPPEGLGGNFYENSDYVYINILEEGDKNGKYPLYTDSVDVYYKGSLIDKDVFDYNFMSDSDFDFRNPTRFAIGGDYGVIVCLSTALQRMRIGDRWMIYISENLGYGEQEKEKIPSYSTLIFEVVLDDIIHPRFVKD